MARLVHYFRGADMRCNHRGLTLIAKRNKLDPQTLEQGEYLLYVNNAQTMAKLLGPGNVLIHLRSERGRLDFRVLRYLPKTFQGSQFDYDAALKKAIERDFPVTMRRPKK